MPHVKVLASGALQVESDAAYFLKKASEERTAALHARPSAARQKHLDNAERFEDRVRAIAVQRQQLLDGSESGRRVSISIAPEQVNESLSDGHGGSKFAL